MQDKLETIGEAIGKIPSGCSILTARHEKAATGILVSWVQQASFDPPCITVCVKGGRHAGELIEAAGSFMLNVIGEDPAELFKHFGKGFGPNEDAFSGLSVRDTEYGPLIETGIAHLGCRVKEKVQICDHDLFVGEVTAAGATEGAKPYVHLRKSGLSY